MMEPLELRVLFAGYAVKDLGVMQGHRITDEGYVLGERDDQPVVIAPDGTELVLTQPGGTSGVAIDRNSTGLVLVNTASSVFPDRAVLYENGQQKTVVTNSNSGVRLTDEGDVLLSGTLAALWRSGTTTSLGIGISASDINDLGEIVGTAENSLGNEGFIRSTSGTRRPLGYLSSYSKAYGVNNDSQVVGESNRHAFLWDEGQMNDLGTLDGDQSSEAKAINDQRQVVGYSSDMFYGGERRAFVYQVVISMQSGSTAGG